MRRSVDLVVVAQSASATHLTARRYGFALSVLAKFPISQRATPTPNTQFVPRKSLAPSNDLPLSTIKALSTCLSSAVVRGGSCCGGLI